MLLVSNHSIAKKASCSNEEVLKRHVENHMHGVLQLRGRGLTYQRLLKDPSILHHQNLYCPNFFSNSQQVLIRRVEH